MKEHYDKLYSTVYSPANFDYNYCYLIGNSLSWTLSGLLRMYQTTGDKAYLVKFINHCIKLQKVRNDEVSLVDPVAAWVKKDGDGLFCYENNIYHDVEPAYFNSLLIFPMAEFVNMVNHDPTLYNTNLPIQQNIGLDVVDINILNSMNPGFPVNGYGDVANWLGKRVEETLFYMINNYWTDEYGIQSHSNDDCGNSPGICGGGMNIESPFGCAVLYMGLAISSPQNNYQGFGYGDNHASYLEKAQIIAGLYKATVHFTDLCGIPNQHYDADELILLSNNSYWWYTRALEIHKHNCANHSSQDLLDGIGGYRELVEDVAHGAMDLWFVRACYETQLAPNNTSPPYFTVTEMERFRNTFTENIYYTNSTGAHFHNNVDGTNNPNSNNCSPNCPTDALYGEALDWMPLYNFDGNGPNVYDILMQHVTGLLNTPATSNLTGAESFLGLSEVVKAQWDMECINLSLYKRNVVYDQDFNVKNILTIEPESNSQYNTPNSFADPVIQTNTFTIQSGVTSNMTAGEEIILKPGFTAKAGCTFSASIVPSLCTDGQRTGNPNANNNLEVPVAGVTATKPIPPIENKISVIQNSLAIYPNPTDGTTNIYFFIGEKSFVTVKIIDQFGRDIFNEIRNEQTEPGNYIIPFDTKNLNSGVYFCILQIGGEVVQTKKMVVL